MKQFTGLSCTLLLIGILTIHTINTNVASPNNHGNATQTPQLNERLSMQLKAFYHNKKVLVTGGCGFIGSHIARKLVELGASVTIIDNLSTGFLHNIETIKEDVTILPLDITDFDNCLRATQNIDIVFHLAAFISVPDSIQNPTHCYKTNVDGTFNILQAAYMNGVPRFVFSSSAAVYGPYEGLCSENSTPCKPNSPYGFSKLIGEQLCAQYRTNFNMATVSLRYFNVWGDGQNPNGAYAAVVAKFSNNMASNIPIIVFGDGLQTRDFVHVSNIVNANLIMGMNADTLHNNYIFNIGTGKSITLLELIEQLKQQYPNYHEQTIFMPTRPGDVHHSSADCAHYYAIVNSALLQP